MTTTFASNPAANSATSYLQRHSTQQSSSIGKLSSGSRIVRASDDAASLSIGTKMSANVAALKQGSVNANQAQSMLQIADGGLSRISDTLSRMKSLATQANAGTMSTEEIGYLNAEYQQLQNQIDTIAEGTKFNGRSLLNGQMAQTVDTNSATNVATGAFSLSVTQKVATGDWKISASSASSSGVNFKLTGPDSFSSVISNSTFNNSSAASGTIEFTNGFKLAISSWTASDFSSSNTIKIGNSGETNFQVGLDASAGSDVIGVSGTALGDATAAGLGVGGGGGVEDLTGDLTTVQTNLDAAIKQVNDQRSEIGSFMSRFETVGSNLATTIENLDAARSTLMDVDVAEEMTKFSTTQVQAQAATAMLAQANQLPQNLMRLLQ